MKPESVIWHAVDVDKVYSVLQSSTQGLSKKEVEKRLLKYGPNRMKPPKKWSFFEHFFSQFHNVLIYVLLAAAVVTAFLEHWIDTGVILGVVLINAFIGVLQEGKAEKALDAIRKMLSSQAMVHRDGKFEVINAEELVPGDIVNLQSGDKVPADLRLIDVKDLQIDEAILTGESLPVKKALEPVKSDAAVADRRSMAYSGTLVTYGTAKGIVVATADETEIGHISTMLRDVEKLETPLLKQIGVFSKWLSTGIIGVAIFTLIIGVLIHNYTMVEMFMSGVSMAVAAIPEGLPAIMTIALAIGVQKMAGRQAIIRLLSAVETLGSVTVICSDKTGTLTRNEMTVRSVITASGVFEVSGSGYDPHGSFSREGVETEVSEDSMLLELARGVMLCNDAAIEFDGENWNLSGDPTEGALVVLGMKSGFDATLEKERWPRTDVIPFESQHGFMATLHHNHEGKGLIYIKGSPETILEMCSDQCIDDETQALNLNYWYKSIEKMAERGERVLAVAMKPVAEDKKSLHLDDVKDSMTMVGIVGMIDPPRDEAIKAVESCHKAGIAVKMITGDHLKTALAVGKMMGIGNGDTKIALSGKEVASLSDEELAQKIEEVNIFARTSPEQKLRLVSALQDKGYIVAMTGDGVNDAPALKRADVGIAMGINGTEVSKEAAEIVLADDNFASIADAIEEGRTVYDNLRKSILFILPTNGGEALIIIAAIMLGYMLPITPVQILWVNMVTAVTLALTLAFEAGEKDVMQRKPRRVKSGLLTPALLRRIFYVSMIMMVGTFGLFVWYSDKGSSIEEARTIAVNTLVFFEIFYLFNTRHFKEMAINIKTFTENRYAMYASFLLVGLQLLFTYFAPMQKLFGSSALELGHWVYIVLVASSVFFLVELEKYLIRKKDQV